VLEGQVRWGEFGLLVVTTAVIVPLSLAVFTKAVTRVRRSGTLGQY
jgi:hypothetical protein